MGTASGLGTLAPLLKVGSGVPVLGGDMCVCTDQSAMQSVTCDPMPAACWIGKGHFWGEGRVPDLQELTNSLQSTKKTRQGKQKCPMTHMTDTSSKGTHLKQTATPKACFFVCLFVFYQTGSNFACTPLLSGSFWKGVSPTTHERCLALYHMHIKRYYLLYNQLHISKPLLLRGDIFIYSKWKK